MTTSSLSTIAQLPCSESLPQNFAKLVGEIDKLLEVASAHPFRACWDCDSVVAFDQPGTRVLLAWTELPGHGLSGVLTISVGPSLVLGRPVMRPDAEALCRHLAGYLENRLGAEEVIWHRIACHMSADWVDLLIDTLPDRSIAVAPPPPPKEPRASQDLQLAQLRAALIEETPARSSTPALSTPMRLAVHSLNATLIAVWGPLGAIAMVHGLVKGEDLRRAAQLMVLTGLASAVLNSPKGQSLLALMPAL